MNIILLTKEQLSGPLVLTPKEDSLYLLPASSASVTVRLENPQVTALLLGLHTISQDTEVTIQQEHVAPHTVSHVLLRSMVENGAKFTYQGTIAIFQEASGSEATQEARGLLASPESKWKAIPALEIFPKNVSCRHAASSAPLNPDSLFTLQARGLSKAQATELLQSAFLLSGLGILTPWELREEDVQKVRDYFSL